MNRTLDLLRELDDIRPDIENFIKTAYELDQANIYLDQMDDYSCFLFDEDTKNKTLLKTREDYVMRKK